MYVDCFYNSRGMKLCMAVMYTLSESTCMKLTHLTQVMVSKISGGSLARSGRGVWKTWNGHNWHHSIVTITWLLDDYSSRVRLYWTLAASSWNRRTFNVVCFKLYKGRKCGHHLDFLLKSQLVRRSKFGLDLNPTQASFSFSLFIFISIFCSSHALIKSLYKSKVFEHFCLQYKFLDGCD